MTDIVERLRERIIADAFERHAIEDMTLAERLIAERLEAAKAIEELRDALKPLARVSENFEWVIAKGLDPEQVFLWCEGGDSAGKFLSAGHAMRAKRTLEAPP